MSATHCEKCGRPSHCNKRVSVPVNAHEVGIYEINVCEECRCEECSEEKDPENEL